MKSLIKPVVLIVLCGLLFFLGTKLLLTQEVKQIKPTSSPKPQDTVSQETYVSKVIISAPWGKKDGEFGHYVSEEEGFVGGRPSTFAVAPNGDIYIADPLNDRIQRFSPEGSFISTIPTIPAESNPVDICIDQNNNIYLLRYGWKPEELGERPGTVGAILKCDQKGNILKMYPVFTGVGATANFVICDKFGRIFYAYPWSRGGAGFYQVGTSEKVFSLSEQKNSVRNGYLGFNSVALDKNQFFRASVLPNGRYRALFGVSFHGDTVKTYRSYPPLQGGIFGCDQEQNIYVGGSKYNGNAELVAVCKCDCERPYIEVEAHARSRTLDQKGNLYILCENENEGIKVIKCFKQQ